MRKSFLILPTALALGIGLSTVHSQPPEGGRPKGELKPRERRVDPKVEAWVKLLAEKITDPHDEIRDSARAALIAVGRPALVTLQPLVNGEDGAKATAAAKLVEAIETAHPAKATAVVAANPEERRPPPPGGGPGGPNPFEALFDDIDLNDKQKKQIDDIHEAERTANDEIREQVNSGKLSREDSREKRREMHEATVKSVKKVLTAEQFDKFEEAWKKHLENRPKPMPE